MNSVEVTELWLSVAQGKVPGGKTRGGSGFLHVTVWDLQVAFVVLVGAASKISLSRALTTT